MCCRNYFLIFLLFTAELFPKINVKNKTAVLEVQSGAHFVVESNLSDFKGVLIEEEVGGISGNAISFNNGVFESAGNAIKLTGNLDVSSAAEIVLNGAKTYKGKRGEMLQKLKINGVGNRLEGVLHLSEAIELQDLNSSATCALQGRVPCNILLNGGKLYFEEDLHFVDDVFFTGSGLLQLNNRKLILGSSEMTVDSSLYFDDARDIELEANLHLAETWTFSGESIIEGNGKILYLEENGEIIVEQGSSLLFQDIILRKVSGSKIRCLDSSSTVSFQNVTWVQDGNYSFTVGGIEVIEKMHLKGEHTFAYQSAQTSTIWKYSAMVFDRGMTFSFDPIWNASISDWDTARNFLVFEDDTSILELKNATLHVTTTSLKLTKGTFIVKNKSYLTSELDGNFHMEEGLIIGNNSGDEDMQCEIAGSARLEVIQGAFSYKNVNPSSWSFVSDHSMLLIASGARLKLHQSLLNDYGCTYLRSGSILSRASGKRLAPVHIGGMISYEVCYN